MNGALSKRVWSVGWCWWYISCDVYGLWKLSITTSRCIHWIPFLRFLWPTTKLSTSWWKQLWVESSTRRGASQTVDISCSGSAYFPAYPCMCIGVCQHILLRRCMIECTFLVCTTPHLWIQAACVDSPLNLSNQAIRCVHQESDLSEVSRSTVEVKCPLLWPAEVQ